MITRPTAWGLYVHVPWCRVRCPYCAFDVSADVGRAAQEAAYVDAVLEEVRDRATAFEGAPSTLYLGGGTPSRLSHDALGRLLSGLRPDSGLAELTVEANPEDVDRAWAAHAANLGVDRVSLGVQTLAPRLASRISRRSSQTHAASAVDALREAGIHNLSVDVMVGLPTGTDAEELAALRDVIALDVPHVSLYGLTAEPDTPFGAAADRLALPDEDAAADRLSAVVQTLTDAGYERYELSNFARPGFRARHNEGYWTDRPYLGVGPSAHSDAPDDTRTVDVRGVTAWLQAETRVASAEPSVGRTRAADLLLAGTRHVEGLARAYLVGRTGWDVDPAKLTRLVDAGLLAPLDEGIRLGPAGLLLADAVVTALCDALTPASDRATG
jgi:oxygen-independent coproporphyrinogen-3 oxidase